MLHNSSKPLTFEQGALVLLKSNSWCPTKLTAIWDGCLSKVMQPGKVDHPTQQLELMESIAVVLLDVIKMLKWRSPLSKISPKD